MSSRPLRPEVRDELKRLLDRYGVELAEQPGRLGGLLRDTVGQFRLEISLLVAAAEEGVAAELTKDISGGLTQARIAQLTTRLETNRGLSEDNARWAVASWTTALSPVVDEVTDPVEPTASAPSGGVVPEVAPTVMPLSADAPMPQSPPTSPPSGNRRRVTLIAAIVGGLLVISAAAVALPQLTRHDSANSPTVSIPAGQTQPPSTTPLIPDPHPPGKVRVAAHTNSPSSSLVVLTWKAPHSGPHPDSFDIYRGDKKIGTTRKRLFKDPKVHWGTSYTYKIRSVYQGKMSEWVTIPVVYLPNPPLSYARLTGSATTGTDIIYRFPGNQFGVYAMDIYWHFSSCGSSFCWSASHVYHDSQGTYSTSGTFTKGTLTPSGQNYFGEETTPFGSQDCHGNAVKSRVTISLTVTAGAGSDWHATAFRGTVSEYAPRCGSVDHIGSWSFAGAI